jgi:Gemin6 protein
MHNNPVPDDDNVHPCDMKKLAQMFYHMVQIETERGTRLEGGLIAIDPVSNTAVLISPTTASNCQIADTELLLIPAVKWGKMRQLPTDANMQSLLQNFSKINPESNHLIATADMADAQARLVENFTRHGLKAEASTDNKVIVQDCVTVRPPYRPEDCRATNEIVLERVQKLMKSFET